MFSREVMPLPLRGFISHLGISRRVVHSSWDPRCLHLPFKVSSGGRYALKGVETMVEFTVWMRVLAMSSHTSTRLPVVAR